MDVSTAMLPDPVLLTLSLTVVLLPCSTTKRAHLSSPAVLQTFQAQFPCCENTEPRSRADVSWWSSVDADPAYTSCKYI